MSALSILLCMPCRCFSQEMTGEAERTGLTSEDDVTALVKELRNEDEKA